MSEFCFGHLPILMPASFPWGWLEQSIEHSPWCWMAKFQWQKQHSQLFDLLMQWTEIKSKDKYLYIICIICSSITRMGQDIIVKGKKWYHNQIFQVSWFWVSNKANNPYISIICGQEEDQISFHSDKGHEVSDTISLGIIKSTILSFCKIFGMHGTIP